MRKALFAPNRLTLLFLAIASASSAVAKQDSAISAGQIESAPTDAEQQRILGAMRNYAEDYTDKLPNFICEQVTSQFEAGRKPTHWHKGDTLTSKLVFNAGKEKRTLELVNNKAPQLNGRRWRRPLTTEGEFGILLYKIFDPATETKFSWEGWDTIRGHRLAKFSYAVDREHSTMSLSDLATAVVPYHGEIDGDPQTGALWRVTSETTAIPDQVRIKSIVTSIDYDNVSIGSQAYLLPVQATVSMVTDSNNIRNELQFQGYRKFGAESTITFGGDDTPTPKEQTPPQQ